MALDRIVLTETGRHYPLGWSRWDGLDVFALPPDPSLFTLLKALPAFLAGGGARRYSALHLVGLTRATQMAGLIALTCQIPIIFELTVDPDEPRRRLRDKVAMWPLRYARLLVALKAGMRDFMIRQGAPADRIWTRPNPVDTSVFHAASAEAGLRARRNLDLPADAYLHLVYGRICVRKNQLLAVKTLAHLPQQHGLILAGPTLPEDQPYLDSIVAEAVRLGVASRLHLRNRTFHDSAPVYHAADSLWLPSITEGLPNVMLEALCCGLPIVANRALNLGEYISDGENGFLVPATPQDFSAAALDLPLLDRQAIGFLAHRRYDANRHTEDLANKLCFYIGLSDYTLQ